jgi:hypothetical protein
VNDDGNKQLAMPDQVYFRDAEVVRFNQLAVKIEMDAVSQAQYWRWLDDVISRASDLVPGSAIMEKPEARTKPPLNTAVYYDSPTYAVLPTGALIRTSCNVVTHAFCAFKAPECRSGVRADHRYVFQGVEKATIQRAPASPEAVKIVRTLLGRKDIAHPGRYLEAQLGIDPTTVTPAVVLKSYRYTFFGWLDGRDALRCSIDRYFVENYRAQKAAEPVPISEVELAVYPRISADVAADPRVIELIRALVDSLVDTFGVSQTHKIKYQRAAEALGIAAQHQPGPCA